MANGPIWQGEIFKLCKPAVFYPEKPVFMLIPLDGSSGCAANICKPEREAIERAETIEREAQEYRSEREECALNGHRDTGRGVCAECGEFL